VFALLRRRDFACLWLAGLVSLTGDRALATALPFAIYQQTGSTLATAGWAVAFYLPGALLGSVAGVFVDRWDRKRIMVGANVAQAGALLLLLLVRSPGLVWLAYPVTFLLSAGAMCFAPAEGALLPNLVEEWQLVSANAMAGLTTSVARLAGPPIGGVLLGAVGLGGVALADGASFLLAAALIAVIAAPPGPNAGASADRRDPAAAWRGVWRAWLAGLRLVRADRLIGVLCLVLTVTSLGGTMIDPLFAPFVRSVLRGDAATLGWLSTVGAVGGLLGGLALGQVGRRVPPRRLLGLGTAAVGALMLALYHQTAVPAAMALSFLLDFALVWEGAGAQTLLQAGVPDRYRGRVFGALGTTSALVGLVGAPLAGGLGAVVGIVPMLSAAGGVTILAGLIALAFLPKSAGQADAAGERAAASAPQAR
jgi:MFS family permease